jgi:ureidoglycolate hydrolase
MTPEAFAPFGQLLMIRADRTPDYDDADSTGWRYPVDLAGTPELVVVRTSFVGRRFSRLERHIRLAQAFVPLGGTPSAVAVASSTPNPDTPPSPESVRAFAISPGVGYMLHPDTWHSLDRYPLWPGELVVVMLTSTQTTDEAMSVPQTDWRLTQEVDYLAEGVEFELVLGAV